MPALKATLVNRSFLTVAMAQTMRFFATGTLTTGMIFFVKYAVGLDQGATSVALATAFVAAGIAMWPWRMTLGKRYCARTNLLIAYSLTAVAVIPLAFVENFIGSFAAALVGVALAGLSLGRRHSRRGHREDEVRQQAPRRMYIGMSSLITTLSSPLSRVFGLLLPAYGYNTAQDVQPASVGTGFRSFCRFQPP